MTRRASLLFFPELRSIAEPVLQHVVTLTEERFECGTFPNGELTLSLTSTAETKEVFILALISPPAERFIAALELADTVRRRGATTITLIAPYLAYSRHDKGAASQERFFFLLGRLFGVAGITAVTTIDIHHPEAAMDFGIPLVSLSPAVLFADVLRSSPFREATIVAPDEGAHRRAEDLGRHLGTNHPIVFGHKTRTSHGVTTELGDCAAERVIIVDDILDTGGTLIEAARILHRNGTRRIAICVSHGLFTGHGWRDLWTLGVERIYTTDSVGSGVIPADERIEIIPIGPMIAESIARTIDEMGSTPEEV